MAEQVSTGSAEGWQTINLLGNKHWAWSAHGPRGGEHGNAPDKATATARAQAAYERLRQPRSTEES